MEYENTGSKFTIKAEEVSVGEHPVTVIIKDNMFKSFFLSTIAKIVSKTIDEDDNRKEMPEMLQHSMHSSMYMAFISMLVNDINDIKVKEEVLIQLKSLSEQLDEMNKVFNRGK